MFETNFLCDSFMLKACPWNLLQFDLFCRKMLETRNEKCSKQDLAQTYPSSPGFLLSWPFVQTTFLEKFSVLGLVQRHSICKGVRSFAGHSDWWTNITNKDRYSLACKQKLEKVLGVCWGPLEETSISRCCFSKVLQSTYNLVGCQEHSREREYCVQRAYEHGIAGKRWSGYGRSWEIRPRRNPKPC